MEPKLLTFSLKFLGTKTASLNARIFEETISFSKKTKIIVVAEEISEKGNENLTLIRVSRTSLPFIQTIYGIISNFLETVKHRKDYDLIFIRVLYVQHLVVAILAKKILRKRFVIWLSNTGSAYRGFRNKFYRIVIDKAINEADAIAASSEIVIEDYEKYLGKKISRTKFAIVRQGINKSRFKPIKIQNKENVLLCVARIAPTKKIEDVIKLLPFLIESVPDIKLNIIGVVNDKNYFRILKQQVSKLQCEKHVNFVGPVPHDELVNYYNSSKIFILMSNEAFSYATLEAMACRIPVIVTPSGTISKIIKDGFNGFLIQDTNPEDLANKIKSLLRDVNYRERIGESARRTVEEEYGGDLLVEGLMDLFKKIVENTST